MVLPQGYIVVESTRCIPIVQRDLEAGAGLAIEDLNIDL